MVEWDRPQTKISEKLKPEQSHTFITFHTSRAVRNILWFDNNAIGNNFYIFTAKPKTRIFRSYIDANNNEKGTVLLRFHGNNGYTNSPHRNVVRIQICVA